jgi:uncharacterized protein (DUF2141 family)
MGQPDGGWYDETPPHVIGATPAEQSVNVKGKKIYINFDEFIKIDNATENVVVSPPQLEAPEIKGEGKRIVVSLQDSLKPNTTYTVDFSDAITDNNEGNPLGNYTYTFSTGNVIDTMEVSGYVVEAETLEPVKGIHVGLYSNLSDSIFKKQPLLRVSKTDSRGHFVIKGVAPGSYRVYALKDADGNFYYSQKSEELAFSHDVIVPSSKPDIRQDTIWRDSLHIDSIARVPYTHFLPDNVVLRAFTETLTDRFLVKSERKEANHFTLYYSYGSKELPKLRGLNFKSDNAFLVEANEKKDTITYWLKDTALVNKDSLRLQMQYEMTDTTGALRLQTDTLELLSKQPYAKRLREQAKKVAEWQKKQDKAKKKGEPYQETMPVEALQPKMDLGSQLDPDCNITLTFETPLAKVDTSKIHLYSKIDTLWYKSKLIVRPVENVPRTYEIMAEWRPDVEYSLEMDSTAFEDIYGKVTGKDKKGFKVRSNDEYSTLFVTINGMSGKNIICQLMDGQDHMVKQVKSNNGTAEFFYLKPAVYYLRMIVDDNNNGKWDTGDYEKNIQPEMVYYYPDEIECKAKWDVKETWNPTAKQLNEQKPSKIVKQKADKKKMVKRRNAERAKQLGIQYTPNM